MRYNWVEDGIMEVGAVLVTPAHTAQETEVPMQDNSITISPSTFKTCTKCGKSFPATTEFFHKHPKSADGLKPRCKACRHLDSVADYVALSSEDKTAKIRYAVKWGQANPEKRHQYVQKNYYSDIKRTRERVREAWTRCRIRLDADYIERVDLDVLYQRDGGRCGICGRIVLRKLASVDHIVPLALGGKHGYVNVQLAHRLCNYKRSHRGPAQMRLWG